VAGPLAVVIPNWNGLKWLRGCLDSIAGQTRPPDQTIVVDNGSTDGSLELLRAEYPWVEVVELGHNTGFAVAANRGIDAAAADAVALVNTDVVLAPDWLERMSRALDSDPQAAAVACKMVDLSDPRRLYDTGDVMRRDGACVQRGRFELDDGRFDEPGEVFGACAGAGLYRRSAVLAVGGFDERFFAYIEDVDLALRLRLAGWRCRYEPAVARHASEGSSSKLARPPAYWIERNTLMLVAKAFPARWLPLVAYRQLGSAWHALRDGRLGAHLRGAAAALPRIPGLLAERRRRPAPTVAIADAVAAQPLRGERTGDRTRSGRDAGGVPALVVSYAGPLGGAERMILDLVPALGAGVCLACPEGPLAEQARREGMRVITLPERALDLRASAHDRIAGPLRLAAHRREVRRLIDALRPELVVAWGMRSAIACAAAAPRGGRRPLLAFEHVDFLPGRAIGRAVRAAAARCDRVVALSHAVARDLDPAGGLGERLRVAHPGVETQRFATAAPPDGRPELLLLGAVVEWKRPDLALEAAALAAVRLPQLRLTLCGGPMGADGPALLERLRERAARPDLAGRVEFTGQVDDPRPFLERASCLLHCADAEPFGLVVVEALASGRPVVAPAAGGPAEVVDDEVGRLYPPGDASAAAAAIVEVLGTPGLAARLGAAGRRRAQDGFTLHAARERWRAAIGAPAASAGAPGRGGDLALVTVTHDSAAELPRLLDSIGRHLPAAQVIVADAGSTDGTADLVRGRAGTTLIELDNVGFGTASNRGLEAASRPVTVFVNPDVELLDDSLAALAEEAARSDRPERILAPLVLLADGTRQDSVHPRPGSAGDVLNALVPSALLPAAAAPWRSSRPGRVGWAVGCCLVARSETFRRLGPFDEEIFLYGEDLDLGLRASDSGIETWYWPSARVVHRRGHSTERSFGGEPLELLARRRREVIARRRGPRRARFDDLVQLITFADRLALKTLARRPAERERRQLEVYRRVRREPLPDARD
jgi:GT2 family glycosyltransferase/glycosyltransferase involved in cell wall biosynthesis